MLLLDDRSDDFPRALRRQLLGAWVVRRVQAAGPGVGPESFR